MYTKRLKVYGVKCDDNGIGNMAVYALYLAVVTYINHIIKKIKEERKESAVFWEKFCVQITRNIFISL